MTELEFWKPVGGFEGLYEVSNLGRVKSVERIVGGRWGKYTVKEKFRKLNRDKDGYLTVTLYSNGGAKKFMVHRLVAESFIPNPHNLPEINHKDEDKTNNCADNLEWCTTCYNIHYGTAIQRRALKFSKTVYQYSINGEFIREWPSVMDIQRILGYWNGSISACCRNERNTAYNFKWSYAI